MDSPEKKVEDKKGTVPVGSMDLKQASELIKKKFGEALNKKPNSTISISKEADYWLATIEMVDEEYLPGKNLASMNDILGVYEVKLNDKGELLSWSKKSSHRRGKELGEIR